MYPSKSTTMTLDRWWSTITCAINTRRSRARRPRADLTAGCEPPAIPGRLTSIQLHSIPALFKTEGLVLFPTVSDETTPNRTRPAAENECWSGGPGVAGSSPVSPTDAKSEFA